MFPGPVEIPWLKTPEETLAFLEQAAELAQKTRCSLSVGPLSVHPIGCYEARADSSERFIKITSVMFRRAAEAIDEVLKEEASPSTEGPQAT